MISGITLLWYGTPAEPCDDHVHVVDMINAASMDESYCTYANDEWLGIHDYDDDTDHDTDDDAEVNADDDTNDDTDDDPDDGGRGNLYPIKAQGSRTFSGHEWAS